MIARVSVLMALALSGAAAARQAAGKLQERPPYEVKATMLSLVFRSDHLGWPAGTFNNGDGSFTLGVLGKDPFKDYLTEAVAQVKGKPKFDRGIRIMNETDPALLRGCHVVFICPSEKDRLQEILKSFEGTPVVTVADLPASGAKVPMINMTVEKVLVTDSKTRKEIEENRVILHIAVDAVKQAKAAGVTVEEKLVNLERRMIEKKADYLQKFLLPVYIAWPAGALPKAGSPYRIGILGDDPFGKLIDESKVHVVRGKNPADLQDCHLVFISSSEWERLEAHLKAFQGRPVVTVADTPAFTDRGTMINMLVRKRVVKDFSTNKETEDDDVAFQGNKEAVQRANTAGVDIKFSLLQLMFPGN